MNEREYEEFITQCQFREIDIEQSIRQESRTRKQWLVLLLLGETHGSIDAECSINYTLESLTGIRITNHVYMVRELFDSFYKNMSALITNLEVQHKVKSRDDITFNTEVVLWAACKGIFPHIKEDENYRYTYLQIDKTKGLLKPFSNDHPIGSLFDLKHLVVSNTHDFEELLEAMKIIRENDYILKGDNNE